MVFSTCLGCLGFLDLLWKSPTQKPPEMTGVEPGIFRHRHPEGNQPIRQQLSREAWVLRTRPFSFFVSATYLLCQGPESRNSIQVSTNSTPSSLHFAICSGFLLSARNLGVQYGRVAMFSIELSFAHMPWQLDTTWHRYLSNATLDEQFKASQSSWFLPTSLDN